jgi:hypothetical protein
MIGLALGVGPEYEGPPKPTPSSIMLINEFGKDCSPATWKDFVGYEDILLLWKENPNLIMDFQRGGI